MSDASKAAMERELAAKKAKLEELRRAKAARQQQQSIDETGTQKLSAAAINMQPTPPPHVRQQSAEDILNSVSSLIAVPAASKPVVASPGAANAPVASPAKKRGATALGLSNALHTDILPGEAKILYEQATQTEESKRAKAAAEAAKSKDTSAANGTTGTSTNTESVWDRIAEDERDEIIHERDDLRQREVELLTRIRELTQALQEKEANSDEAKAAEMRDLSKQEQEKIESSEEFGSFLNRSSKIMERLLGYEATKGSGSTSMLSALGQKFDFMSDYSEADDEDASNGRNGSGGSEGKLTASSIFSIEGTHGGTGTTNRPITSIHWSEKYPELLSASYAPLSSDYSGDDITGVSGVGGLADGLGGGVGGLGGGGFHEQDGCVLVWNLHMAKRPEYTFTCQSAIHTAQFHPAHPKLLIGGCENGQLLIWDMRTSKQTPVNRSSLSHGHTHPVFSLQIQPLNSGLFQLVSCSSDGQVCIWTENNLHRPVHDIQLINMRSSSSSASSSAGASDGSSATTLLGSPQDLTTTMFDLPGRDTSSMILGSDEGKIYKARLHEQKDEERIYETLQAHDAPMTSIEFHPSMKQSTSAISSTVFGGGASDLFLTSSYDWTVKLWSNKLSKPLYTFESARDYVYSASWSPSNPYLFASGDGTGKLDLWSLAGSQEEAEVPLLSVQVGGVNASTTGVGAPATSPTSSTAAQDGVPSDQPALTNLRQNHAISKLKWNDTGNMIACGTSSGALHLYEVSSDLHAPSRENTDRFWEKISNRITHPH